MRNQHEVRRFANYILHGDKEHRKWLLEAAEAFIKNEPMPEPRGKGKLEILEAQLDEARAQRDAAKADLEKACGLLVRAKATAYSNLNMQINDFLRPFLHQP